MITKYLLGIVFFISFTSYSFHKIPSGKLLGLPTNHSSCPGKLVIENTSNYIRISISEKGSTGQYQRAFIEKKSINQGKKCIKAHELLETRKECKVNTLSEDELISTLCFRSVLFGFVRQCNPVKMIESEQKNASRLKIKVKNNYIEYKYESTIPFLESSEDNCKFAL